MRLLEKVYWLRLLTGFLAAVLSIAYVMLLYGNPNVGQGSEVLFSSVSLSIIVYVLSYYVFKAVYKGKVAKTQKLMTTGIGIYFLAWIVFFVLFYTWLYVL